MTTDRSPVHTGGCQCGAVRYALYAEPIEASLCHCRMCQKAMGNAFAPLAKVPLADFAWTRGTPSVFRSSPVTERGFCAACGSPLSFAYTDAGADWIEVTMGSLDNPDRVKPTGHFGVESKVAWLHLADGLPGVRTEDNTLPERLARIVNYQHPDHDTPADWKPTR